MYCIAHLLIPYYVHRLLFVMSISRVISPYVIYWYNMYVRAFKWLGLVCGAYYVARCESTYVRHYLFSNRIFPGSLPLLMRAQVAFVVVTTNCVW